MSFSESVPLWSITICETPKSNRGTTILAIALKTNINATQQNVLNFAETIQAKVKYFFNINLEIEPRVIS